MTTTSINVIKPSIPPLLQSTDADKGPPMGFGGTRDKIFFVCWIRDWLKNCRGIRDSNICGIRDLLQIYREIRD